MPTAACFWALREGDTVLDLVVKARRGKLGNAADPGAMYQLLSQVLGVMQCSARIKQDHLRQVGRACS